MDLSSMFSQVIPTMIFAWVGVIFFIVVMMNTIKRYRWLKNLVNVLHFPQNYTWLAIQLLERTY